MWHEPNPDVLEQLTRWAVFSADHAVIEARATGTSTVRNPDGSRQGPTPAELTRVAVKASLRMLLANGLITALLPDENEEIMIELDAPQATDWLTGDGFTDVVGEPWSAERPRPGFDA